MQQRVLIAGANGMTGGLILQNCLERNDVSHVTIIVRRSLNRSHPKLTEIIHGDFMNFSSVAGHFDNQDVCFFCIGVYTGQLPKAEFIRITVDVTRQFAQMLRDHSPAAAFCFLSGQGADPSEKSRILFARAKGKAENFLLQQGFKAIHIFRPGYIYPVTPRKEPNLSYRIMRLLYGNFLSFVMPSVGIASDKLAAVMTEVGLNGGGKVVYENSDLRKFRLPSKRVRS